MKIFQTLIAAGLLSFAEMAFCGTVTGTVAGLLSGPEYGTRLFVVIAGVVERPACATNQDFQFVIDTAEPGGKLWASLLLAAHSSGKVATISGTNTCNIWSTVEDLRYIFNK